ncbi:hypothetical protein EST38_g496 [Candolleomyces aberdarensis]|uniref:Cerato-platanin n=1 Tax=Candolleomyces aberdarensis TaxID=2316362 RepID=A0A4Q2DZA9_9AGAR|nr:hypothetical protein EST38_g496 [Candolleomyces aberdarensis]
MKFAFTSLFATLAYTLVAVAQPPLQTTINFDDRYCVGSTSLQTTACSTGENGLITRGFPTFGSLPTFPAIAGSQFVEGFNSTSCGACWEVFDPNTGRSVFLTLVNTAPTGFTLCTDTLLALTGFNRTNVPNSIPVEARAIPAADCGL